MPSALDHLYELHSNPFIFASAMLAFYEELGEKERSVLLAYLVLPIALDIEIRKFLRNAKSTSNLRTFSRKDDLLRALPERIGAYREHTNATLRYLFSLGLMSVSGEAIIVNKSSTLPDDVSPEGLIKASRTLARFFKEYQVPMVYRMLGVMAL